jgi:hypothetical protein
MEEIVNLFHGFAVAIQPFTPDGDGRRHHARRHHSACYLVLAGQNGVAILLPLTFSMSPTSAIIMLSCIYWGALFGGAITSVLFNIPGEPWSVRTTFDGHPMAQQGRAGEAPHRRLHVVVRGCAVRGGHDHAACAAGCQVRACSSVRPRSSASISSPSAASWA